MSQTGETFFTSVGCMDGRSQCAVAKWGRKKFDVEYADAITEAGLVKWLSKDHLDQYLVESLENKIKISVEKHHSKNIVVSGHEDCAGHQVSEKKHKKDILKAAELLGFLFPKITIVSVFVKRDEKDWIVEKL